jgi:antibiotic biosynthesis monooxygenase (ABM) superfamily enzyme
VTERYVRIVSLWVHGGQEAAFEAFEREAVLIMARHGGRIDHAIRLGRPTGASDPSPFELHIVSFANEAAAAAYALDPETLALRERRAQIFAKTVVQRGRTAGPY